MGKGAAAAPEYEPEPVTPFEDGLPVVAQPVAPVSVAAPLAGDLVGAVRVILAAEAARAEAKLMEGKGVWESKLVKTGLGLVAASVAGAAARYGLDVSTETVLQVLLVVMAGGGGLVSWLRVYATNTFIKLGGRV
jgi:phage shock protein PspC (stress-responsive transcriptional regulator)